LHRAPAGQSAVIFTYRIKTPLAPLQPYVWRNIRKSLSVTHLVRSPIRPLEKRFSAVLASDFQSDEPKFLAIFGNGV
jgi:hypothetical protein